MVILSAVRVLPSALKVPSAEITVFALIVLAWAAVPSALTYTVLLVVVIVAVPPSGAVTV
jgi:hypothetical protein